MPPKKKVQPKAGMTPQEMMDFVNQAVGREVLKPASHESFKTSFIPTGLLPVDVLLQGGIPRGRFSMIVGDYSTLKSYIGLCAIKECQEQGGIAGLIDTERAFDPQWAEEIGVDVDALLVYPPKDAPPELFFPGELAIDAAEAMTRAGVDLLVFDSIAATLPQAEQNKRLHDENIQPARTAALMSAAARRLTAANSRTAYLWVNQFRVNVGMTFGDPNVITGGKAMPYFSSYIIIAKKVGKVSRDVKVFDGDQFKSVKEQVIQKYQLTLTKSKLNKPFRDVFFDWSLVDGSVDMAGYLMSQGLDIGKVKMSGTTWSYGSLKATGRDKFRKALAADKNRLKRLENDVRASAGLPTVDEPTQAPRTAKLAQRPKRTMRKPAAKKSLAKKRTLRR